MNDLRVLVVAQDSLARTGLAALLGQQPGCNVVGQSAGDATLSSDLDVYRPDVLLWDLGWDPRTGLEHLASLPDGAPPALALVADESPAGEARSAGAAGVLFRESDIESLSAALAAVARGLTVFDPALFTLPPHAPDLAPIEALHLTPREMEALALLAEGLANKAIASRLGISEHTAKFHVNSILSKLSAQSRTEAVTRATRLGLILL